MKINLFKNLSEDSIQKKAIILSLVGTAIIWIIFTISGTLLFHFRKPPEYKTINLRLENPIQTPVQQVPKKVEVSEEKVSLPIEKQVETQTKTIENVEKAVSQTQTQTKSEARTQTRQNSQKSVSQSSQNQTPRTQNFSKNDSQNSSSQKKANVTYKKSIEEQLAEQLSRKKESDADLASKWDEMFSDSEANSSSETEKPLQNQEKVPQVQGISNADALSGTAGTASSSNGVAFAQTNSNERASNVSSKTASALENISKTTYRERINDDFDAESSINATQNSNGNVELKMDDGSSRILINPKKPSIIISKENGAAIDSQRTVMISFRVLPDGNVPLSGINFTPSSLLTLAIQSEIRDQISKWQFSPSSGENQAKFELVIKKR